MAEVVLEGLGKTYPGGVEALAGLSLRVAPGELLTLVGPSGCGKTTTLRLIAGLERPTAGAVRLDGRDVTREPPHRRDVAFVFQRPALYPHLSVAENLAFGLTRGAGTGGLARLLRRLAGRKNEVSSAVRQVAEALGLTAVLDRRPRQLSGGQQQRVALGRALARRPAVYLLDEPLSNLDAPLRLEMRRELHLLQRRLRATMVYVTHDQEEALTLGDAVAVLDAGRLQQVGRPDEVYARPANAFVAGTLGWPPISLLDGALVPEAGRLLFRGDEASLPVPEAVAPAWQTFAGRELTLGLRAEHVTLGAGGGAAAVVDMEVRQVEWLGGARRVVLGRGRWAVAAQGGGVAPAEGALVPVALDLAHAHLFERATGRALAHGALPRAAGGAVGPPAVFPGA